MSPLAPTNPTKESLMLWLESAAPVGQVFVSKAVPGMCKLPSAVSSSSPAAGGTGVTTQDATITDQPRLKLVLYWHRRYPESRGGYDCGGSISVKYLDA